MGLPQTQSPAPHLYPQAIQLKLYQAFIFSIPILFSIILFLLFYLFYLKRRANSSLSQTPPILRPSFNRANPFVSSNCQLGLKGDLKDKLPTVLFDEELRARDALCCVCLGEFELKEQLLQIPSCKHVFHGDCIHHWLYSNLTCPLCRCSVLPTTTILQNDPVPSSLPRLPDHHGTNNNTASNALDDQQNGSSEVPPQQQASSSSSSAASTSTVVLIEE
ncbi:hypothetical protein SLA2020_343930 [Shorea laevis]